ncbi:MAG: DUF4239 domain-containing protein [Candidatus Solibacter sp.]
MEPPISLIIFAILLLAGMQILMEAGRRLALARRAKESEGERSSLGAIEGAVFVLFGLLMAFTFSGAALRFNEKRMLVADEANAIRTAHLRLQLLAPEAQPKLQELFRKYVESRLETYRRLPDMKAAELELANTNRIQEEIWTGALVATRLPTSQPAAGWLLPPALNNMINIVTTRTLALKVHPPENHSCAPVRTGAHLFPAGGYRMASGQQRSWVHILGFTVITVIIVDVMLDIEYPLGLFRLTASDELLSKVRAAMK